MVMGPGYKPLAHKRPFPWISSKIRLMRAAMGFITLKLPKLTFHNSRRRYMAGILPIRRKHRTTIQSINQSINQINRTMVDITHFLQHFSTINLLRYSGLEKMITITSSDYLIHIFN